MVDSIEDIEDALSIPIPSTELLVLDDTRRLTGPSLLWERPGAVLDVFFNDVAPDAFIRVWQRNVRRVLNAVGWLDQTHIERQFDGGANLAISAPMDQLYSAIFVAQTAWHFSVAELLGEEPNDFASMVDDLKSVMQREANPRLIALMDEANRRQIDVLCDDDDISLGHGMGSQTWPVAELPEPNDVDWDKLYNIPVALITGTNGKTTTTRLCSAIVKASGKTGGLTSTDFVQVGDDILDHGDYSGPGGARMLLRDPRLEVACLEVARGGILRRGLPVRRARVAVVTNVAADHLGQYGVNTVAELTKAKFAVHRTLVDDGVLVLNADDPFVVAEASRTPSTIWWFSLHSSAPQITASCNAGLPCAWLEDDVLVFFDGAKRVLLNTVAEIPISMGGAAHYNILNALAAICASRALGISYNAIRLGLSGFQSNPNDNPGRCNEFEVNGARVFVDFAHNPHSISAVTQTMAAIPAKRRFVMLSHAGDRSDKDVRDVTNMALSFSPDYVIATELPDYLRGRELGEIPLLIQQTCKEHGIDADHILMATSPSNGVAQILKQLQPGDLALLLTLSERDKIFEMLKQ
jgi:UDP-N-acetylmuramyl tripeptide synthase